jgi:Ser/Thr protein kinase RdoA (MazF antagonist)
VCVLRPEGGDRYVTELVRPTHLLDELARNGALRTTGLYLTDPDLTYDQLEAVGGLLGRMHQSLRFAIGDWLLLMEERWPEQFSQASEVLGLSEDGRREYLRVSQQVPRSVRREELSWSHHRAVAALEPPEQARYLEAAVTEHLSHHELRQRLKPEPVELRVCGECGRAL